MNGIIQNNLRQNLKILKIWYQKNDPEQLLLMASIWAWDKC